MVMANFNGLRKFDILTLIVAIKKLPCVVLSVYYFILLMVLAQVVMVDEGNLTGRLLSWCPDRTQGAICTQTEKVTGCKRS